MTDTSMRWVRPSAPIHGLLAMKSSRLSAVTLPGGLNSRSVPCARLLDTPFGSSSVRMTVSPSNSWNVLPVRTSVIGLPREDAAVAPCQIDWRTVWTAARSWLPNSARRALKNPRPSTTPKMAKTISNSIIVMPNWLVCLALKTPVAVAGREELRGRCFILLTITVDCRDSTPQIGG